MALSQCAALMEDVPHRRARSGPGPLGRKRLQGGTESPTSGDAAPGAHTHGRLRARLLTERVVQLDRGGSKNISAFSSE